MADPFQRYRGLEVAADSPRPAEAAEVRYHCVGDLALTERSTAAGFARAAHAAIDAAIARGSVPIVAGGTGLYLRAALTELGFPAEPAAEVRDWAEGLAARAPDSALAALRERDPEAAARVDAANPRRLARALAAAASGGAVPPSAALWSDAMRRPALVVAVVRSREELDRRIAARVQRELDEGLVAELEAALETPGVSREAMQVIGAREVAALRAGELEAAELPERLAARTRRLARRQLAWLRKTPVAATIDLGAGPPEAALSRVLALWRGARGDPLGSSP